MNRLLLASIVLASTAACGSSPGGRAAAKPSPALTRLGLTAEVQSAGVLLRQHIGEKLAQAKTPGELLQHTSLARHQLDDLRAKSSTKQDQYVGLLLAALIAKDHERLQLVLQSRQGGDYESVAPRIGALYESREACNDEVLGWLEQKAADQAALENGPCLAEALAAPPSS